MKNSLLQGCNLILAAIEKEYYVPRLHVDSSKKRTETQLNGLCAVGGLRGMLEGQNYKKVDMVFPFLAGFMKMCTERVEETLLTKVYVLYSEPMLSMEKDQASERWNENKLKELQCKIE